jgi:arginine decarboxylase
MNHKIAPLYDALCIYERKQTVSLHVPGHKDGQAFDQQASRHFREILKIDATEVNGLDDLHHPTEAIAEAQRLAADAFGAEQTYFLVGGSTAGNLAAALTVCQPGDRILVQRNAHKSVFNGLLLAGAHPIFIAPEVEPETDVATGIEPSHLRKALQQYPDVKAVWITNPNYYGMGINVTKLVDVCHQAGIPLLVDEAHGAHLGQVANVPCSALEAGADLVVQSTHKMLTAMTMASMLHVQGPLIPRERLAAILAMVQSSSPSYPLMASLDVARRYLIMQGREQLANTVVMLEKQREQLAERLQCLSIWTDKGTTYSRDPLKWVLTSRHSPVTGYQLLAWLEDMGCVAEMADTKNVVLVFAIHNSEDQVKRTVQAIQALDAKLQQLPVVEKQKNDGSILLTEPGQLIEPAISLQEAFHQKKKQVPLAEAIGKYSAEMVIPYPPGIPLLAPGEKITETHITAIQQIKAAGGYFQGASDEGMEKMFILVNP